MSIKNLSTTAANNNAAPPNGAPEGATLLKDVNDILRQTLAEIRTLAASDTIASATTTDLGSKDATFLTVSGTTTITGLGTVSAGIYKAVTFSDALTLTHNATSLILPGAANITTAAGDTALFLSLGFGNWKCMFYQPAAVSVAELKFVDGVTSAIQTQLNAKAALAGSASQSFSMLNGTVAGTLYLTGAASILGYNIGAGGAVTQTTNKFAAVTLNRPSGQITMNNAALAAGATATFVLNNTLLTTAKNIFFTEVNATGSRRYSLDWNIGNGYAYVHVTNETVESLSDAVVINFAVIGGATS